MPSHHLHLPPCPPCPSSFSSVCTILLELCTTSEVQEEEKKILHKVVKPSKAMLLNWMPSYDTIKAAATDQIATVWNWKPCIYRNMCIADSYPAHTASTTAHILFRNIAFVNWKMYFGEEENKIQNLWAAALFQNVPFKTVWHAIRASFPYFLQQFTALIVYSIIVVEAQIPRFIQRWN